MIEFTVQKYASQLYQLQKIEKSNYDKYEKHENIKEL